MKVLHIVESFDGQATEAWLADVYEHLNSEHSGCEIAFYCRAVYAGAFVERVRGKFAEVYCAPVPISKTFRHLLHFRSVVSNGGYDIVHSHCDLLSAVYFLATIGVARRPKFITHVHNLQSAIPVSRAWLRFLLRPLFRSICLVGSSRIVGVSKDALDAFVGVKRAEGNSKYCVIHCSVRDYEAALSSLSKRDVRQSVGVPESAVVLLFVGRMVVTKNPGFVVDLLVELRRASDRYYAVFVGAGPLTSVVATYAQTLGVQQYIRVLGWRDDVADFLCASDVLVWPGLESIKEGLGLGVVEAQSAGLPVIMSKNVPNDAIVCPALVNQISLESGPVGWANVVEAIMKRGPYDKVDCYRAVESSSFSISTCVANLNALYAGIKATA